MVQFLFNQRANKEALLLYMDSFSLTFFTYSFFLVRISHNKSCCQWTALCIVCVCVYGYVCGCVCYCSWISGPLCVCGLCLGVSVSHLVCFLEGVRSCSAADTEHKDALSGVWTIGQVWNYGGNRDLCMHTHRHTHSLSQGSECRGLPRARGDYRFPR